MLLELVLGLILEHEDFNRFPCVTAFQNKASATLPYSCGIGVCFCCYCKCWELLFVRETMLTYEDLGEAS